MTDQQNQFPEEEDRQAPAEEAAPLPEEFARPAPAPQPAPEPVEPPVPGPEEVSYPQPSPYAEPFRAPQEEIPEYGAQHSVQTPTPPVSPVYYPPQQPQAGQQYAYPQPPQPPVYQPAQGYYQQPPQGVYYYAPYPVAPPKKKMSTGLKVFIWIASVLAGLAILSFAGFLLYSAVTSEKTDSNYSFPYGDFYQSPYGDGDRPFTVPEIPDQDPDTPHGDDDTPDFDDGVVPPDTDKPKPDVDVTPNTEGITISKAPAGAELSAKQVYDRVVKSTVTVACSRQANGGENTGTGTGVIATSDGYIITNAHVVLNSRSTSVRITTYDGQEYDALVVGLDRTSDLAVLKTNDHNFTPAEFGDAGELSIGDQVVAIGNPGGVKFSGSMTGGYISGLDREVGKYSENGMTYLQTDAAINPGNSGGPLVNMYGQVVGINSSKIVADGYEGMGFAIPVSQAKDILDQLLSGGYVKGRTRLGISGLDGAGYGFKGFMIQEINEDSAFVGTEARSGDIIVAIDGEEVTCLEDISNLLLKYAPGDTVTVTLARSSLSGEEFDVEITLLEDKGETQG